MKLEGISVNVGKSYVTKINLPTHAFEKQTTIPLSFCELIQLIVQL